MSQDKNEKLMRAMGEIDDDLIAEARETARPRAKFVRWTALAACLGLLLLCTPILMTILGRMDGVGEMEKDDDVDVYYTYSELLDRVTALENQLDGIAGGKFSEDVDKLDSKLENSSAEAADRIQELEQAIKDQQAANQQAQSDAHKALADAIAGLNQAIKDINDQINETENKGQETVAGEKSSCGVGVSSVVVLSVELKNNAPLHMSIKVTDGQGERVLSDGELAGWLTVSVDGQQVSALPSTVGVHEIRLDMSALLSNGDWQVDSMFTLSCDQPFVLHKAELA